MNVIEVKKVSPEATCLDSKDILRVKGKALKSDIKMYRVYSSTIGLVGKAKTCLVKIEDLDNKTYIADMDTGSLYDVETMRCLTGDLELRK